MSDHEPSVKMEIFGPSISIPEHRNLRNAIDAASVQGTITWVCNSVGAPVAAIVPVEVAEKARPVPPPRPAGKPLVVRHPLIRTRKGTP